MDKARYTVTIHKDVPAAPLTPFNADGLTATVPSEIGGVKAIKFASHTTITYGRIAAIIIALCGANVSSRLFAQDQRDVLRVDVTENQGIQRASLAGDKEALRRVSKNAKFDTEKWLAAAMLARMTGNFSVSDQAAKQCLVEAKTSSDAVHAIFGVLCNQVIAGNSFLRRDYQGWATKLVAGQTETKALFDARYQDTPYILSSLAGLDPVALSRIQSPSKREVSHSSTIRRLLPTFPDGKTELRYDPNGSSPPWMVKAIIDGTPLAMRVDTGAVVTNLNAETAKRLNVRPLAGIFLPFEGGSTGRNVASSLVQVTSLQVGSIESDAWQMALSTAPDLLGSDYLRSLGAFRIDAYAITSLEPHRARCAGRLLLESDWLGQHRTIALLPVDGVLRRIYIDIGNDGPLTIFEELNGSTASSFKTMKTFDMAGEHQLSYKLGQSDIDGHPVTVRHVIAPSDPAFDYTLGSAALKDVSLTMDFTDMRVCVSGPASREPDPSI